MWGQERVIGDQVISDQEQSVGMVEREAGETGVGAGSPRPD